jgi:hypothetical protein
VRLADREAVTFLRDCQADGIKLENCPAYVREWMERKNLREPAMDGSGSSEEVDRRDEYMFFGAERCRSR